MRARNEDNRTFHLAIFIHGHFQHDFPVFTHSATHGPGESSVQLFQIVFAQKLWQW